MILVVATCLGAVEVAWAWAIEAAAVGFVFWITLSPASGLTWRWFHLVAYSLHFLEDYVGILAVIGEFRRAELLLFLDILNPSKMASYVSEELRENEFQ